MYIMLQEYHVIYCIAFGIIRRRSWNVLLVDTGALLYSSMILDGLKMTMIG
jgi:hypothetical protein